MLPQISVSVEHYNRIIRMVQAGEKVEIALDMKVKFNGDDSSLVYNTTSYMGANLKAYERLGAEMGYALVGCELSGINAFFVRRDLCGDKFAEPFTAENHFEPPRYFLLRRDGHPRCFTDIKKRE